MRLKTFVFILVALGFYLEIKAQQRVQLYGKITNNFNDISNITIRNQSSGKGTISDTNGYFNIAIRLNDTLLISAVQFKSKKILITDIILKNAFITIDMENVLNYLDEVVVSPYNLAGDLRYDLNKLSLDTVITASSIGLPNAGIYIPTQAERNLFTATDWNFKITSISIEPILNAISGRTKNLKERVKIDAKYDLTKKIRRFYADSIFVNNLKIPKLRIADFMYFCEVDTTFLERTKTGEEIKIWEFLLIKSKSYRLINNLE